MTLHVAAINNDRLITMLKMTITELSYFDNFKDAIEEVGLKKVLPNASSLKEGVEIYHKIPSGEGGTYKEASKKYGVLRMKFNLC